MSIALALLTVFAAQDPLLGEESKVEDLGFAIRGPKGWRQVKSASPTLFRVQCVEGAPAGGDLLLILPNLDDPLTPAQLGRQNEEWLKKKYEGCEIVKNETRTIAGCSSNWLHWRHKETSGAKVGVFRGPTELFMLDLTAQKTDEAAALDLVARVAGSMRFWTPEPTAEEKDALDAGAARLKESRPPAGEVRETHKLILIAGRTFGRERVTVREAEVDGRKGFEFRSETLVIDSEGSRRAETVAGWMVPDGSYQRVEVRRTVEIQGQAKQEHAADVVLRDGKVTAKRTIRGEVWDAEFDAGSNAWLAELSELATSTLAMAPKGIYAIRTVECFAGRALMDQLEVAAPDRAKLPDGERLVRMVLSERNRNQHRVLQFEEDGRFLSLKVPGVRLEMVRTTPEEYEKVK